MELKFFCIKPSICYICDSLSEANPSQVHNVIASNIYNNTSTLRVNPQRDNVAYTHSKRICYLLFVWTTRPAAASDVTANLNGTQSCTS